MRQPKEKLYGAIVRCAEDDLMAAAEASTHAVVWRDGRQPGTWIIEALDRATLREFTAALFNQLVTARLSESRESPISLLDLL